MSEHEPGAEHEDALIRGGRRRGDHRRIRGRAFWVTGGIALAFLAGVLILALFTQTGWGRDKILAFTVRTIGGRLNGRLTIERLEGNVLTGAWLYEVLLTDTVGVPLARIDSAYIQYRIPALLGSDIIISRVDAFDAEIDIFRLPGDTIWNYDAILRSPHPDTTATGGAILIQRLRVHDTRVVVGTPLEADPRLPPAIADARLAEIRADTARFDLQEVAGGTLRLSRFDVESAAVLDLFIGPDERGGTYLDLLEGRAEVRIWKEPPLELRTVQGRLQLQDGVASFEVPHFTLPDSEGELLGRIDLRGERPLYDLIIGSPHFTLADLRWLYPWLPEDPAQGEGAARLWIEDRDDDLLVLARNLVLRMPDTRITGEFGLLVGIESLRFIDVDLEADPLRIESVEQLLPEAIPVRGLTIGAATIRGEG